PRRADRSHGRRSARRAPDRLRHADRAVALGRGGHIPRRVLRRDPPQADAAGGAGSLAWTVRVGLVRGGRGRRAGDRRDGGEIPSAARGGGAGGGGGAYGRAYRDRGPLGLRGGVVGRAAA